MRKHVVHGLPAAELDHGARGLDDGHPDLPVLVGDGLHQWPDERLRLHVEVVCGAESQRFPRLLLLCPAPPGPSSPSRSLPQAGAWPRPTKHPAPGEVQGQECDPKGGSTTQPWGAEETGAWSPSPLEMGP